MINSFLSKLNPNSELTPEERTLYAKKLEYIASKTDELEKCTKDSQDITDTMNSIERQFKQLETIIYTRQQKYQKLCQSIQRLNDTITGFPYVVETTKATWDKFSEIEKLITAAKEQKNDSENPPSNENSPRSKPFITPQGSTDSFGSSIDPPDLNEEIKEDISSPLTVDIN